MKRERFCEATYKVLRSFTLFKMKLLKKSQENNTSFIQGYLSACKIIL